MIDHLPHQWDCSPYLILCSYMAHGSQRSFSRKSKKCLGRYALPTFSKVLSPAWGGGALPLKGGTGMCRGHDPFFHASRHSLAYQFPNNALLMCPSPFSNFRQICIFSLVLCQNVSSQEAEFLNFYSKDPSFFKESPLLRP